MTAPLSFGLGSLPAGVGPAGHDLPAELQTQIKDMAPTALAFDPYDRVYVQNDDFTMASGTGPIQRAALLMLPLGSIAATPSSGLDISAIRRASPAARVTVITDALTRAWKTLIETNQIALGKVTIPKPGPPWDGIWEVEVTDLVNKKTSTLETTKLVGKVA